MRIEVATIVKARIDAVWRAYTNPDDIVQWNAASDDWHTPRATVDLRPGGRFCWRMESRDGRFGFDFEGTYTAVVPHRHLAYDFGDRKATVDFVEAGDGVRVTVSFDSEQTHSIEQQREGWQAILDRFQRHVESKP